MNYIKEYYNKISTGEIVAGRKVIKIYKRLVEESENNSLSFVWRACHKSRVKVPRGVFVANSIATCKA